MPLSKALSRLLDAARRRQGNWEVNWGHPKTTDRAAWARNPKSNYPSARKWHLVGFAYLRASGVNTPVFRKDSWEVDWSKRKRGRVWARNIDSKMPNAREWHWIDYHTVKRSGIKWRPVKPNLGRSINAHGYVVLTRRGMTKEDIAIADEFDLWHGRHGKKHFVKEHRLVAAKKFGVSIKGMVVRHRNGVKSDNDPDNILIGTTQQNTADHNNARLEAAHWRSKFMALKMRARMVLCPECMEQISGDFI